MKSWIWASAAVLTVAMVAPGTVLAGANPDAVLALHVSTQVTKNPCSISLPSRCEDFVTQVGDAGFRNVYLMVANYDSTGIAGLQFGVEYQDSTGEGCDIQAWVSCADLDFANDGWPSSGTGNLITWDYGDNCQGDTTTYAPILAGVFQVTTYSADMFRIVPRPVDGKAKVANCLYMETDITDFSPSRLGEASFGMGPGYNPCLGILTPVRPTTWGSIKALYEK
jgi:hypothetical protein